MKLSNTLLLASSASAGTLCTNTGHANPAYANQLIEPSCDSDGIHLHIDELCRSQEYGWLQWPSTFVDGQKTIYEMPAPAPPSECLAQTSPNKAHWEFNTPLDGCNIQDPTIWTDPDTKIEYFVYTLYLNFDNFIPNALGTGNLQQLEQVTIECKISRKWQEDATSGSIRMVDSEIIDDMNAKADLWKQLQLDVYKGGFSNPAVYQPPAIGPSDTVKIGEHIKLEIANTPPYDILSKWNVAIEDCWASTVENRAIATDMDTGVIHFDPTGTAGIPDADSPVGHETVKFWDRQCPTYNWVTPIFTAAQPKNTEVFLRQFAFNDNQGTFTNDFFYHCIVVLCELDDDCVTECPADRRPKPADNAPQNARRRRAIVSSHKLEADFVPTIDFGRDEAKKSGEINPVNLKLENDCEFGMVKDGNAYFCKDTSVFLRKDAKDSGASALAPSLIAAILCYVMN